MRRLVSSRKTLRKNRFLETRCALFNPPGRRKSCRRSYLRPQTAVVGVFLVLVTGVGQGLSWLRTASPVCSGQCALACSRRDNSFHGTAGPRVSLGAWQVALPRYAATGSVIQAVRIKVGRTRVVTSRENGSAARGASRSVVALIVVAAVALMSALLASYLVGRAAGSESYPAKGFPEEVTERILAGKFEDLQPLIKSQTESESSMLTFRIIGRTGEIIAASPKSPVGEALHEFYIVPTRSPVAPPWVLARESSPNRFVEIVFHGYDPDDGRVALHFTYVKGSDEKQQVSERKGQTPSRGGF